MKGENKDKKHVKIVKLYHKKMNETWKMKTT